MIQINLIRDKRGLEFKSAFFGLIMMSMSLIAIGVWIGDWNSKYNSGLTYDLESYSKLNELSDYASTSKSNISVRSSFETGASGDFEGTSLRGAFGIVNNIFTPFNVVFGDGGLLDSIQTRWGIPNYIMIGIISMMVLAILFALIALFFRKPGGST